jgi:hypothetical protein
MVPCDIVKYLNVEYGKYSKWAFSNPLRYNWANVDYNSLKWSDDTWPSIHKVYTADGKLNIDDTVFHLKHNTNFSITVDEYRVLLKNGKIREILTL